jgi:hypothetical protein
LFEAESIKSVVPLDDFLGLTKLPFKITVGAMLQIAYYAQKSNSYEEAVSNLRKETRIDIDAETLRNATNNIGKIVFDNDYFRSKDTFDKLTSGNLVLPPKDRKNDLYIECDGAMFHTRERTEDGYTWRENKLGVVFSSESFQRWTNKKTGKREKRIGIREYTAYAGTVDIFQKFLFDCALRNGYGRYENTILISDGATWIKNMKELLFPDAIHILDYFHLCENVHKFAKEYFHNNDEKAKNWANCICIELRKSKTNDVLKSLANLNQKRIAKCEINLKNYINNNINNIDYVSYEKNDWFIGSGAIESGNKTVLQERLKLAGMRWNVETARYVIALMTKVKSNLWESDVVDAVNSHYGIFKRSIQPFSL